MVSNSALDSTILGKVPNTSRVRIRPLGPIELFRALKVIYKAVSLLRFKSYFIII